MESNARRNHPRHSGNHLLVWLAAIVVLVILGACLVHGLPAFRNRGLDTTSDQTAETAGRGQSDKEEGDDTPGLSLKQTAAYPRLKSSIDYDNDGIDDYTDLVQGAHEGAERHRKYDTGYYQGGYPPDDRGACTDEIWRDFSHAGYDLKAMVDADIAANPTAYSGVITRPDPNIDFRRTNVLGVFFGRYAQELTTDTAAHDQWQQGDIVIFDTSWHIGMVSDRRDKQGVPLLLHNMAQKHRENDYLGSDSHRIITGHFRFDASRIPQSVLKPWDG